MEIIPLKPPQLTNQQLNNTEERLIIPLQYDLNNENTETTVDSSDKPILDLYEFIELQNNKVVSFVISWIKKEYTSYLLNWLKTDFKQEIINEIKK